MTHWTKQRRLSFYFHAGMVLIPFTFSTVSAGAFWYNLFQNAVIAGALVIVVDILALSGLILYIARIESPFQSLRHVLPVVSVVPLGLELWSLLAKQNAYIAGAITAIVTSIMVVVAWQCFTTIERQFIPPLDAAREKAEQDVKALLLTMEQLRVVSAAVEAFRSDQALTVVDAPMSKTARVKQLSDQTGDSVSTIWRKVKRGEIEV